MKPLLVMSCDRFQFLWDASIQLILKYWPETKIYLVTEERKYKHDKVHNIRVGRTMDWSKRFLHALDAIPEDSFLLTLDDFLFEKNTDVEYLEECLYTFDNNDMVCLRLTPNPQGRVMQALDGGTFYEQRKTDYRISTQVAIWSKEYLQKILRKGENAWQFELDGTVRSYSEEGLIYTVKEPVVYYQNGMERGALTHRGRGILERNNIPVNAEMERKIHIETYY